MEISLKQSTAAWRILKKSWSASLSSGQYLPRLQGTRGIMTSQTLLATSRERFTPSAIGVHCVEIFPGLLSEG